MYSEISASSRSFVVGIAGPSGAGKTEIARRLSQTLDAVVCSLDSYYRGVPNLSLEERGRQNFDNPEAIDHELLCEHLRSLARGESVLKPVYDFARHIRLAEVELCRPSKVIVVEGLFALHWEELRALLDLKVYVAVDDATCLERRIARDVRERGRSPESIGRQYELTVRPMAQRYIHPTREFADLVLNGDDPLDQVCTAITGLLRHR
jgi:uridine kinase